MYYFFLGAPGTGKTTGGKQICDSLNIDEFVKFGDFFRREVYHDVCLSIQSGLADDNFKQRELPWQWDSEIASQYFITPELVKILNNVGLAFSGKLAGEQLCNAWRNFVNQYGNPRHRKYNTDNVHGFTTGSVYIDLPQYSEEPRNLDISVRDPEIYERTYDRLFTYLKKRMESPEAGNIGIEIPSGLKFSTLKEDNHFIIDLSAQSTLLRIYESILTPYGWNSARIIEFLAPIVIDPNTGEVISNIRRDRVVQRYAEKGGLSPATFESYFDPVGKTWGKPEDLEKDLLIPRREIEQLKAYGHVYQLNNGEGVSKDMFRHSVSELTANILRENIGENREGRIIPLSRRL